MHDVVRVAGLAAALLFGPVVSASAQATPPSPSAQQPAQDYQQRVTKALESAKRSADTLNERHKSLVDAVKRAADPQQAQKVLDELIASANKALEGFGENSEMMQAVNSLLGFIDDRRRNAENELKTDPQWLPRVNSWKAHGDNIRDLRQALLREVDRSRGFLERLGKERKLISDIIADEGVTKAKQEMEKALDELKTLGDSLDKAVTAAQNREKAIGPPAF
jgi:hypothetical protein